MKKIIGALIVITLTILFCTGCQVSNTELANSLDGNMTRLVYSIGYLDSISATEIQDLSVNSTYFANYATTANYLNESGADLYRNSNYRSNVYNSELNNEILNNNYNETIANQNSTNYCTNCKNPITNQFPDNIPENTSTTNQALTIANNGNATTNTLGGLCNNCNNVENTINQINNNEKAESSIVTSNYVDISLLLSSAEDLNEILLSISQKRGIIMLYCTDLRSGNIELGDDDKAAISEYITIIKETINYLNNNSSTLTAHMNNIKNFAGLEGSQEVINAKLIRVNEVLKTRYAKLDTCIDSLDAIIAILQRNVGIDYTSRFLTSEITSNNVTQTTTSDLNNANKTNTIINSTTNTNETITPSSPANINNETITNSTPHNITTNNSPTNYSNCPPDNTIVNFNYSGCNNADKNTCDNFSNNPTIPNSSALNNSTPTTNTNTPSGLDYQNNITTNSSMPVSNSDDVLNGIGAVSNPHGIGIKSTEQTLTGIPYNSTSVNTPKPGTLISAITLPTNEVTNSQNNEQVAPETPVDDNLENTPMILPELEHDIPIMETPNTETTPQIIKELGNKVVSINPIYDNSSNLKPLPFLPGI